MTETFDRTLVYLGFDKREVLSISNRGRLYFGIALLAGINMTLIVGMVLSFFY